MGRLWLVSVGCLLALSVGCSNDGGSESSPGDVQIVAGKDGTVEVIVDGRVLFALASGGPVARNFNETFFGQPEQFERTEEVIDPLSVRHVTTTSPGAGRPSSTPTLATEWETTGAPILRHMMLNFPDDPATWDLSDQYMLGDSLLVAPVLTEGASSRAVYFPPGKWFNVWTGNDIRGPVTVDVPGPIGRPPVYALNEDRDDLRNAEANLTRQDCR